MLRIVQNLTFASLLVAGVVATGNDTPVPVIMHQFHAARLLSTAAETTSQWIQIGSDIDGENERDFAGGTQGALAMNDKGTTLVVGASGYNNGQGHTRVFDLADGVWTQRGKDIKGEFGKLDNSGASVVVSTNGNVVGIGEPNSDAGKFPCENPCEYTRFDRDFGQVRVFEWTEGAWLQRGKAITGVTKYDFASEAGGLAMDSSGSTIVVGSREHNGARGHVRVFKWTADEWVQRGGDIDGEGAGDFFGGAVATSASGDTVAAGALFNEASEDPDLKVNGCQVCKGSVRIFDWKQVDGDLKSWVQRGGDIDGEDEHDYSGSSVKLSTDGDVVAVGAPSTTGQNKKGSVTVYEWGDSASWEKRGAPIEGEEEGDLSGSTLALSSSGDTVAIGAYLNSGDSDSKGHVRVFKWTGDGWVQRGDDINGENKFDNSGYSLAMDALGNTLASGARYTDDAGQFAGQARVFHWSQEEEEEEEEEENCVVDKDGKKHKRAIKKFTRSEVGSIEDCTKKCVETPGCLGVQWKSKSRARYSCITLKNSRDKSCGGKSNICCTLK